MARKTDGQRTPDTAARTGDYDRLVFDLHQVVHIAARWFGFLVYLCLESAAFSPPGVDSIGAESAAGSGAAEGAGSGRDGANADSMEAWTLDHCSRFCRANSAMGAIGP